MATFKPTGIPGLPPTVDPGLRQFLSAIKENLEVRLSQRGNALDAAPTFQDLIDSGILTIKDGMSIGGRSYTAAELMGLVEFTLPSWITSDTAPSAPTGFTVGSDKTNTVLGWVASTFDLYAQTQVWRATINNLSSATQIGATSGYTYVDSLPAPGASYFYWIRHTSQNGLEGPFNAVGGTSTALGPGAVTISSFIVGDSVDLSWPTPVSNLAVQYYQVEYLNGSWIPQAVVAGNSTRFKATWLGARTFRVTAVDINGQSGSPATAAVTITAAAAPSISYSFDGESVVLKWDAIQGSLPTTAYEVYLGSVSPANLLVSAAATSFRTKVTWSSQAYVVRAIDAAGNPGASTATPITVATASVSGMTLQVVDNNVLLKWESTPGSLPILTFELRRGSTWAGGTVVGKKDGGFTTVFETVSGTYTYWLSAVDTAGNYGTPQQSVATVSQPPDYVLAAKYDSAFAGTKSNALLEGGALTMPIDTAISYADHFTVGHTWASPQAQIAAGYPIYAQPGVTTGYYEEVFDYGTLLAAMKVSVDYLLTTIAGTLSSSVTITVAQDSGFTTGVQTISASQFFGVNFRYIKVRVTVTATDDHGIATLDNLTVTLDAKLKTVSGMCSAVAGDAGGTIVYLTQDKTAGGEKVYVDVDSINLTPLGTTRLSSVYDFTDVPSPLSFKILLFDSAGARATGTVSYTVRGY